MGMEMACALRAQKKGPFIVGRGKEAKIKSISKNSLPATSVSVKHNNEKLLNISSSNLEHENTPDNDTGQTTSKSEIIRYISIPESILNSLKLGPAAKAVYGILRFYAMDSQACFPAIDTIASMCSIGRSSVSNALRQLELAGLISTQRRFKKSSIYTVKGVKSSRYLRITTDLLADAGLSITEKFILCGLSFKQQNDSGRSWAFQETLASELGISRRSVLRAVENLETAGKIEVQHRGGGRSRGNYYRTTAGFYCAILAHGTQINCDKSNRHKINNLKELKGTSENRENAREEVLSQESNSSIEMQNYILTEIGIDHGDEIAEKIASGTNQQLKKLRTDIKTAMQDPKTTRKKRLWLKTCILQAQTIHRTAEESPETSAYNLLKRHGVHKTVAENIVFVQKHPVKSIENAVHGAIAKQAKRQIDRQGKPIELAKYIVGTLNQARREAHEVRPAAAILEIKRRASAGPAKPMNETEFERRRRMIIEQLDAAESISKTA